MEDNIKQLADISFIVRGIVTDNNSTNVSAFNNISNKYGNNNFSIIQLSLSTHT